jgi:hypothetical protein
MHAREIPGSPGEYRLLNESRSPTLRMRFGDEFRSRIPEGMRTPWSDAFSNVTVMMVARKCRGAQQECFGQLARSQEIF